MICINKLEWFILSEKTKKSKGKLWTSVLKKVVTDLSTGGDAELRSPELKLRAFRFRNCMWHEVKNPLHCNYHETSAKEERGNQTQKKWKPQRPTWAEQTWLSPVQEMVQQSFLEASWEASLVCGSASWHNGKHTGDVSRSHFTWKKNYEQCFFLRTNFPNRRFIFFLRTISPFSCKLDNLHLK